MATVLWLEGGACSGNTMSYLDADDPNMVDLIVDFGLELLWHPALGPEMGDQARGIITDCASGAQPLDIFVFAGSASQAPNGTGGDDMFAGRAMTDWVRELCAQAIVVVAIGDCAAWGGTPTMAPQPPASTGLQFHGRTKGGLLGAQWTAKSGLPVINIPGCPANPDRITQVIVALAAGRLADIELDELNRPTTVRTSSTQTGHARNRFFEYPQSTAAFGQGAPAGCLFYEFACRGPMTHSPCNRILWNRQSAKTRTGMPRIGCTEPEFPFYGLAPGTVFRTQKVCGVSPKDTPETADHPSHKATAAAQSAAPKWSAQDIFVP